MNLKLVKLMLTCKKEVVEIPFASNLTYFYGKMGAGKTTVLQLIDYCLGNELIETPALQQEFVSAELEFFLGDNKVILFREKGSNQVHVEWTSSQDQEVLNVVAPIVNSGDLQPLITGTKIILLTDLLFYLGGYEPPLVRKSKRKEDTELIRLSFRDLMWYCYLKQDEIDSSFFHLEKEANNFKKLKSKDVMRLILGYHQEQLALLESELIEVRNKKLTLYSTAKQLQTFLKDNQIDETATILSRIDEIDEDLKRINDSISIIKEEIKGDNIHLIDEMKEAARDYAIILDELSTSVYDIEVQISKRKKLLGEFASAKIKINRSLIARNTLKDISFTSCPQCERDLIIEKNSLKECSLCKVPFESHSNDFQSSDIEVLKADLTSRHTELQDSIIRLSRQKDAIIKKLKQVKFEKQNIDIKLQELQIDYDSMYLAKAKELERTIGELSAEKKLLQKLLPLTNQVKNLQEQADDLSVDEECLKRELEEARGKAEEDNTNLEKLKSYFLENLIEVGLPGVLQSDVVVISTKNFVPKVYREKDDEIYEMQFSNLSSGGKKTIYKCCFALAIHRLAKQRAVPLPNLLMIDTPMKNISERENLDIFKGFYTFLYRSATNELNDIQFVIVDKEYYPLGEFSGEIETTVIHMTPDDPLYPPLIPYYKGH